MPRHDGWFFYRALSLLPAPHFSRARSQRIRSPRHARFTAYGPYSPIRRPMSSIAFRSRCRLSATPKAAERAEESHELTGVRARLIMTFNFDAIIEMTPSAHARRGLAPLPAFDRPRPKWPVSATVTPSHAKMLRHGYDENADIYADG